MHLIHALGAALGTSWTSGINLYAATFVLGILGQLGVTLPGKLDAIKEPWIIALAGVLYCVEFFADKIPWLDSAWDAVHTFIRVPAGAALAYLSMSDYSESGQIAAALLGGGVALSAHGTKAAARVAINASPEPFSNWAASIFEDFLAVGAILVSVFLPLLAIVLVVGFVVLALLIAPRIYRAMRALFVRVGRRLPSRSKS